jgi:hypothetical protein
MLCAVLGAAAALPTCAQRSVPVSSAALVTTPQELSAAVASGREHVVITQHLDLRSLPSIGGPPASSNDSAQGPAALPALFKSLEKLRTLVVRTRRSPGVLGTDALFVMIHYKPAGCSSASSPTEACHIRSSACSGFSMRAIQVLKSCNAVSSSLPDRGCGAGPL